MEPKHPRQNEVRPEPGHLGARCTLHPDRPALGSCTDCGRPCCPECAWNWEGDLICRTCIRAYRAVARSPESGATAGDQAWPPRILFSFRILRMILLSPGQFFDNMPSGRGIGEPILFAFSWSMLIFFLAAPANYLTLLVIVSEGAGLRDMAPRVIELAEKITADGFWKFAASAPERAMVMIMLFLALASLQHVLLMAMGRRHRFELTVRVACFSMAAQSLTIIPLPGISILAATVYTVVLQAVGFQKVCQLKILASVFISVFPMLVIELIQASW